MCWSFLHHAIHFESRDSKAIGALEVSADLDESKIPEPLDQLLLCQTTLVKTPSGHSGPPGKPLHLESWWLPEYVALWVVNPLVQDTPLDHVITALKLPIEQS